MPEPMRSCRALARRLPMLCLLGVGVGFPPVHAQVGTARGDSASVVLGAQYSVGGIKTFFWGDQYRAAWASEVRLPILDLATHAGGLRAEGAGGGSQTTSLYLRASDRRLYMFRLIDKDPTRGLSEDQLDEPITGFLQDQVSSLHPLSALVAHGLEEAAGVIHPSPSAYVMPDDPALGEFRAQFAGRPGLLVERLGETVVATAPFGGFDEIIRGEAIFDRLAMGRRRIDAEAFLRARLLDLVLGDWNRHAEQWAWGRGEDADTWEPIALDRDHAFSRRDGLVPWGARYLVRGFVGFGEEFSSIYDLHHASRRIDRRLLSGLDRASWDTAARWIQARLTDAVIDSAVRRLPQALYELDGGVLAEALRLRRDRLPEAATTFYELLAEDVEVYLTDTAEDVRVTALDGGPLEITAGSSLAVAGEGPRYHRVFDPDETEEVRLFLGGGDDEVTIQGATHRGVIDPEGRPVQLGPLVRVIGESGDDRFHYDNPAVTAALYDAEGENVVMGSVPGRNIDRSVYDPSMATGGDPTETEPGTYTGDWTVPIGTLDISSDFGLFVGVGGQKYRYGFRRDPYEFSVGLTAGISTQGRYEIEYLADFRKEASARHLTLEVSASNLDVVNFFGFGNDTRRFVTSDSADARRRAFTFQPRFGNQLSRHFDIGFGATVRHSLTRSTTNPFLIERDDDEEAPGFEEAEGVGGFWQVGAFADARYDTRDGSGAPTRGVLLEARGAFYPGLVDVGEIYGSLEVFGRTYLTPRDWPFAPTLALRAGARKLWGEFPFFDAAFVGGSRSLRGYDRDRFSGDFAMSGTAELRLRIARPGIPVFGSFGVLGFVDAGRVYVKGDSPGSWHTGYGGGLWLAPTGVSTTVSAVIAHGAETTRFYIYFGMPF